MTRNNTKSNRPLTETRTPCGIIAQIHWSTTQSTNKTKIFFFFLFTISKHNSPFLLTTTKYEKKRTHYDPITKNFTTATIFITGINYFITPVLHQFTMNNQHQKDGKLHQIPNQVMQHSKSNCAFTTYQSSSPTNNPSIFTSEKNPPPKPPNSDRRQNASARFHGIQISEISPTDSNISVSDGAAGVPAGGEY